MPIPVEETTNELQDAPAEAKAEAKVEGTEEGTKPSDAGGEGTEGVDAVNAPELPPPQAEAPIATEGGGEQGQQPAEVKAEQNAEPQALPPPLDEATVEVPAQALQAPLPEIHPTAEAVAVLPPPILDQHQNHHAGHLPPTHHEQPPFPPHHEPQYHNHGNYSVPPPGQGIQQHPHDGGITVLLEGAAGSDAAAAAAGMAAMPSLPPVNIPPLAPPNIPAMYPRNVGMPEVLIPAKWLARYEELKRYKEVHGHTNVPQKYEQNPQLGAWCRTQKQQMKLLTEGKPSHMSQGRLDLLQEIGFEFTGEKRDKFWNDRYRELVEFHAKNNGSTRVPDKYDEAPQLNSWVALQRLQLKKHKEGKKSKLTPERIALLEALGLEYRIRNTCTWMERFLELKDYKEQHGNCNVPQKYKKNVSLGRWVDNQKTQHKKLYEGKPTHLTIERIQLLVGLGFQWR